MLVNLVPVEAPAIVVVPSGFTRRACGVVTTALETPVGISLSAFSAPFSSTTLESYHLPSFALTTRLPWSSVYTTVPASPLRNALTFVVKSLPFKPSAPVKPSLPMPAAVVPVVIPGLPSRPSAPFLPMAVSRSSILLILFLIAVDNPRVYLRTLSVPTVAAFTSISSVVPATCVS